MTVLRTVTTLALLPLTGPAEAWIHLPATTLATLPGDLLVFHRSGSRPAFHPSQD